jgi:hypothetical protein
MKTRVALLMFYDKTATTVTRDTNNRIASLESEGFMVVDIDHRLCAYDEEGRQAVSVLIRYTEPS